MLNKMSKKEEHPYFTWVKLDLMNLPFYCGIHKKTKLKWCGSELTGMKGGTDIVDIFICPHENCKNRINVESFYKKTPTNPIKLKKQKRLSSWN